MDRSSLTRLVAAHDAMWEDWWPALVGLHISIAGSSLRNAARGAFARRRATSWDTSSGCSD
jgi:hypothetical protein